jgi:hypothetical protein
VRSLAVFALLLVVAGCYDQPEIPRDKPLSCTSPDESECPTGFVCVANRVCAPRQCMTEADCPVGLVCARSACVVPAPVAADGGVEDGAGAEASVEAGLPEVPPTLADAPGGS